MGKIKRPFIDINMLNPLHQDENDDLNCIRYCPNCRNLFRWVKLIKTPYGWWVCPVCDYRGYEAGKGKVI